MFRLIKSLYFVKKYGEKNGWLLIPQWSKGSVHDLIPICFHATTITSLVVSQKRHLLPCKRASLVADLHFHQIFPLIKLEAYDYNFTNRGKCFEGRWIA